MSTTSTENYMLEWLIGCFVDFWTFMFGQYLHDMIFGY
jgi:hypothetical protein